MSAGAIDAIGVVSGVLGIVQFLLDNFPSSDPMGASIQVKAGLGDDMSSNLGGGLDHAYGFDFNNNYLGESGGCSEGDGGVCTVVIDQSNPGVQSDYVSISNNNDATCISWISVTQFDGSPGGAWTGDIGYSCGTDWYYGNQAAGTDQDGNSYRPFCAWIDGDHTNGFQYAAFKFTVRAYGELSDDTLSQNHQCDATIFGADTGPINGQPSAPSKKRSIEAPAKRAATPRLPWMENRLIVSDYAGHTAEFLCNSETSVGPDFIGTDGMFCDMGAKTLSPLCQTKDVDGCIVVEGNGTQLTTKRSVARRVQTTVKNYEVVSLWGTDSII